VLGLLAWHHVEHERWRYSTAVLAGMAGECLLWALALVGLARLQERFWPLEVGDPFTGQIVLESVLLQAGQGWGGVFARVIGFCGAGLYEEVLFRLLLLPAVLWTLERLGFSTLTACFWSLILTSLLFSAAHYVGPLGDTFELYSFTFRALAGCFFGTLFLLRGFGIAAGTHACYDLIIGLL
jgi:membrane protease YdiL (CAAX protease family)